MGNSCTCTCKTISFQIQTRIHQCKRWQKLYVCYILYFKLAAMKMLLKHCFAFRYANVVKVCYAWLAMWKPFPHYRKKMLINCWKNRCADNANVCIIYVAWVCETYMIFSIFLWFSVQFLVKRLIKYFISITYWPRNNFLFVL